MLNLENHQEIKDFIESLQEIVFPFREKVFDVFQEELEKKWIENFCRL